MNIMTSLRPIVAIIIFLSFSSSAFAAKDSFQIRIEKQIKAVLKAKEAKEIDKGEMNSLNKEIAAIQALFDRYWKDKKISASEAKTLDSKLDNSDVNLFRKKYD